MVIPMLKIRRPTGRLIFNMGIPIPGKTVFYIETGPRSHCAYRANQTSLFSNPLMLLMCATNVKFAQEFIIYGKLFQKRPFPHIIPWFESWIELLGPVLINLHQNAFDTAVASRWTRRAVLYMSALFQLMVHFFLPIVSSLHRWYITNIACTI